MLMPFRPIPQCDKSLDFRPRVSWPRAFPAFAWQNLLLTGFERKEGQALDLCKSSGCNWLEAFTACYSILGFAELTRLYFALKTSHPELAKEFWTCARFPRVQAVYSPTRKERRREREGADGRWVRRNSGTASATPSQMAALGRN